MRIKSLVENFRGRGPVINIVLDGWGCGDRGEGDGIFQARTPVMDGLTARYAGSRLLTHGHHVGLPSPGDIGGSEVGHMTMGAGRILPQGPTRIKQLMESGEFYRGEVLGRLIRNCLERESPLHLLGLLSDGNVHSHFSHFEGLIHHAARQGVKRVYIHALLDGRDVPYQSALEYVEPLEALLREKSAGGPGWDYAIASGGGREAITMDRDQDWEKVRLGWEVHVKGRGGEPVESAAGHIRAARGRSPGLVDQDIPPFVVVREGEPVAPIQDGHSVIFMNFRGDRAIEFSRAMVEEEFTEFNRGAAPEVEFAGMMAYDEDTNLPPQRLVVHKGVDNPFGKRLLELGLHQFRLAESQKYAHVTFFFNGGYREPLEPDKEQYCLIPSERVASFANAPEMRAREVGAKAVELIKSGRFRYGLINFANADMVGHTGKLAAVRTAAEAVDRALGPILAAVEQSNGLAIITADHGNAEEMIYLNPRTGKKEPNTRHSINPVPVLLHDHLYKGPAGYRLRQPGGSPPNTLSNLMATNYILLGLMPPDEIDLPLFELD